MTTLTEPDDLRKLLERPDQIEFAKRLAQIEPDFYSFPELGWRVAGADSFDRRNFYRLLSALVVCGKIGQMSVWHNEQRLRVVKIEFDSLRSLFASLDVPGVS